MPSKSAVMRGNVFFMVCFWQLFCLLCVSAVQSGADVSGMSVGLPIADSGSATTELVPRANMRSVSATPLETGLFHR